MAASVSCMFTYLHLSYASLYAFWLLPLEINHQPTAKVLIYFVFYLLTSLSYLQNQLKTNIHIALFSLYDFINNIIMIITIFIFDSIFQNMFITIMSFDKIVISSTSRITTNGSPLNSM